ncbi:MAG: sterol desaturase family protein [Gemmataceae bacterium]
MEWLGEIGVEWLRVVAVLAGLAVVFGALARLTPCNPGMYWWNDLRAVVTDFIYWFVVPLFIRVARVLLLLVIAALLWGQAEPGFAWATAMPLWLQCVVILLIQDVWLYWGHRLFHGRWGWRFHAVHHSPEVLDWLSAARFHPINHLLTFGLADVGVLLLGFSPAALVLLAPFNLVYSAMVHANLNWTFGPLRYVFASPVFHRWHHTSEEEGLDRNFAPTFPFLDVLFGTFYMPPGRVPEHFGIGEPDFPRGFWGQFFHPFRPIADGVRGVVRWGGRHPVGASVMTAGALAVIFVLGRGMYLTVQQLIRHEEQVRAAVASPAPPVVAELPPLRQTSGVLAVAMSSGGERIVSGCEDGTITVWDGGGHKLRDLRDHTRAARCVAVSGDGRRIVSGGFDRTVRVWDAETGESRRVVTAHTSGVLGVAISGDGTRVASGGADATARVWEVNAGDSLVLPGPPDPVLGVAANADGSRVVTARGRVAIVTDIRLSQQVTLTGHTDLIYAAALTADGRRVVTASRDGTVKVWDAPTGRVRTTLRGHADAVYGVAISADGRRVASGGEDRIVRVWDADTGRELHAIPGHKEAVTSVAMSASGGRVASASRDGTVKVWDDPAPPSSTAEDRHASR